MYFRNTDQTGKFNYILGFVKSVVVGRGGLVVLMEGVLLVDPYKLWKNVRTSEEILPEPLSCMLGFAKAIR